MGEKEEEEKKEFELNIEQLSFALDELMKTLQQTSSLVEGSKSEEEDAKKALFARFDRLSHKMSSGFKNMMQALIDMSQFLTQTQLAACTHSYTELSMMYEIIAKHWHTVLEKMARGEEIATALGISSAGLDGMYDLSKLFLEHQHFEEAQASFCLLSLLAPEQEVFWLGLGHSEYCLGNYTDAQIAYTMASEVSPQDPSPHLFIAHCFRARREDHLISYCFGLAEHAASNEVARREVRESIDRLKEAWKV